MVPLAIILVLEDVGAQSLPSIHLVWDDAAYHVPFVCVEYGVFVHSGIACI